MVNERSHSPWSHVVHTIEVRDINRTTIRCRILLVVLVHVQAKQNDIDAVKILKDNNAFASVGELVWIVFERVTFLHPLPDFELFVHGRHLADRDGTAHLDLLYRVFERDAFFQRLLLGLLGKVLFHLHTYVVLEVFRKLSALEVLRHRRGRDSFNLTLLLSLCDSAPRTCVLRSLVFILASVEEGANLVDPSFTTVTLHPAFFVNFIVFLLR
mmetsp:Transcript_103944/g.291125  ORF Transcript_103944/g.291125 Transcript_103944/m.291125 type:complete len:213 (-) Transcript_103944:2503-3141(-)